MISIKKYLNSQSGTSVDGVLGATRDAYRSLLTAVGVSAMRACPHVSQDLPRTLTALGQRLSDAEEPDVVSSAAASVDGELQQWGDRAQAYFEEKTSDVKELLVILGRTASTIGATDSRYTKQLDELTKSLQGIATLDDLTQVRSSIIRSAGELRSCVEQMSQDARQSVARLQAEVATYQAKLEQVEELASQDELTGLFNRGRVMEQIEQRIATGRPLSVAVLDLNGFKQVNDQFGHAAGDDLLKQFGAELRSNARSGDIIGRWGGDEFIMVLPCLRSDAQAHVDRIEKWVCGDYTIETATGKQKVHLRAAIGIEEWRPGMTMREIIDRADASMYERKTRPAVKAL